VALFVSQAFEEALAAERSALSLLPEHASMELATMLARAVQFYERAASNPAATEGEPPPGLIAP
jgi:hypothetical protein